ncbi:haloacid dehalogenase-like hydrolase [Clostridium ganghwense]|uniref:phosphoserine phosphatase n=1 Tax=Clostridium ganghwense TaxID=312089 RepID=A0ABT4CK57_9CLOT|nr:haloacid dehalogenase-like hydrolase [Clostridium ganghwense]MCY6369303.1 haloacid dehalogenase-like hydrolase [Clostridium ganghwense]
MIGKGLKKKLVVLTVIGAMLIPGTGAYAQEAKNNYNLKLQNSRSTYDSKISTSYIKSLVNSVPELEAGRWSPNTYNALKNLILRNGIRSTKYNYNSKPYAVFDWDQTSIYMDTEEALFRYQIENLVFKMTPEEFSKVIRKDIPDKNFNEEFNNKSGKSVNISKIGEDLDNDYKYLYNNYVGLKGKKSLEEIKKCEQFKDFRAKLYYLYESINGSFDASVGYPWVLYMFKNMNSQEVRALAQKSDDFNLADAIEKRTWTSSEKLSGKAGVVSVTFTSGLRTNPEVINLMHALAKNGIDVYICSASFEDVIKEFACSPKYGYNLPEDHVIAMKLERDKKGIIQAEYKKGYPQTQGEGKTKAIKDILVKKYGHGPVLVCGDSNGDVRMMSDFKDTQLVLINNRLKSKTSPIGKLSQKAAENIGDANAKYILQGRDENIGLYRPSEKTIKLGSDEERLLHK